MGKILTIGEAMGLLVADTVGNLEEVSNYTRYTAGAEMNVAIGTSRLGFETCYVTQFGNDPIARYIKSELEKENINTEHIRFNDKYTTGLMFKERVLEGDPLVSSFRKNSAATKIKKEDVSNIDFSQFKHLHLSGVFLGLSEDSKEISHYFADEARKANAKITFDPNLRPGLWQSEEIMVKTINEIAFKADIVLPGIGEGKILTGFDKAEDIAKFYLDNGVKAVIIKLGADGAYVQGKDQEGIYVKGFKVEEIVDTVGAGDGFAVGVITAISEKKSLEEAAKRGNAIGAIQLMSPSDNEGLPTREKLENFMNKDKALNY